jgi:probable rRNA maturation factor
MPEFEITISDQQTHVAVPARRLRDAIERVLVEEGISSAEISLALVDDAAIHRINRDFLGHDHPTDVISFVLECGREPPGQPGSRPDATVAAAGGHLEGELVVSTETAVREALVHGWSAADELLLYVVHGLLHLCGYDDLTDEARPLMRTREREMLAFWQLTPTGLEA